MPRPRPPIAPTRSRPVADLSLEGLLGRSEELARRWAIALVVARPLQELGAIPLEDIARDAPALCEGVLRALVSEEELERLAGPQGAGEGAGSPEIGLLGTLAGVTEPAAVVGAMEALREAIWEMLIEELPAAERSSGRRVADLADRLAHVCAVGLAAALAATPAGASQAPPGEPAPRAAGARMQAVGRDILIVDERSGPSGGARPGQAPSSGTAGDLAARGEIEIRDERGWDGPAAWIGSIGGRLRLFERDRVPFAVMLVELLELDSLGRESPQELARISDQIEQTLQAEIAVAQPWRASAPGSLTRERPGRYWLLVGATDRGEASRLAERLGRAVEGRVLRRVVIGTAVCPDDGEGAPALAAHADVGLYAARADARTAAGE